VLATGSNDVVGHVGSLTGTVDEDDVAYTKIRLCGDAIGSRDVAGAPDVLSALASAPARRQSRNAYGGGWTFDRSGIVGSARRDTYEGELTEAANAARASADDSIGQFHHLRPW
jgi:hypothetical protein